MFHHSLLPPPESSTKGQLKSSLAVASSMLRSPLKRLICPTSSLLTAYIVFVLLTNNYSAATTVTASNQDKYNVDEMNERELFFFDKPVYSLYFNSTKPQPNPKYQTGSFSDCTEAMKTSTKKGQSKPISDHPDASMVTISCREIHFRAPLSKIEKGGVPIVVGVLSGASGKGPIHRDSIRSTWARESNGVYFIVAGPWKDIEDEYNKYRDLIWIDEDEVYEGEESVLPFKTQVFLYVINKYTLPGTGFEFLFKTDDDSYVNLNMLQDMILNQKDKRPIHYWGCCTDIHYRPLRHPSRKWRITFELYPEEYYPLYCQGAGFAVSREMAKCITHEDNIKKFRYNPFEDVSVGLLAERCGFQHSSDCKLISQYRTKSHDEIKQLNGQKRSQIEILPKATMKEKVLQHRVKTHMDMYAHHKCVVEGC